MLRNNLAKWLKAIIIGTAVFGIVFYFGVIPIYGKSIVAANPEFSYCYLPWLILILVTAIPCYGVLILGWKISGNIGKDKFFAQITHDI